MKKGQLREAITDLTIVLKQQPQNIEALYSRGMHESFRKFSIVLIYYFILGLAYSKQGNNEEAIADLTAVLNLNPDHVNAAFARAACYNKLNDLARAIEDYNFALFKDQALSSPTRDDFSTGGNRARTSSTGSASTSFMLDSPYGKSMSSNMGDAFSPPHSIHESQSSSRPNSKRLDIDAAGIFSLYGVSSPTLTHRSNAVINSVSSSEVDSPITRPASSMSLASKGSTVTFKSLADYRTIGGRVSNTSINLDEKPRKSALKTSSSSSNLSTDASVAAESTTNTTAADQHHSTAYEHRRQGNYTAAVLEYTLALAADPRHFKSLFNRGFAYDKLGEYEAAIKDYSTAIEVNPDYAFCYYNRGITYDHMMDLQQACRDFSKAIELLPENIDFYHNRAYCLRKLDRFDEAIRDYSAILLTQSGNFKALYNRSLCYDRRGNMLNDAMNDINQALQIQPTHAGCLLHRALLHEKNDCFDKALLDYSLILQQQFATGSSSSSSVQQQALTARGKLFARMNRHDDAIRDYSTALEQSPQDLELLLGRAMSYKAQNHFQRAIEDLTTLLSIDKESVIGYSHRGYCYRKLEQLETAIVDYSEAIRLVPNNIRALNHRGYLYARLGQFQEAIDDYTAAIALDGNNGYAYHNRGIAYDKIGLIDQAIADFGRAFELEAKMTVRSPAPLGARNGGNGNNNNNGNGNGLTLRQQAQLRSRSNFNNNMLLTPQQQQSQPQQSLLNSGSQDNTDNNSNTNSYGNSNNILAPAPRSIASSNSGNNYGGASNKGYFSSSLTNNNNNSNPSSPLTSPMVTNRKGMNRPRIGLEYAVSSQQQQQAPPQQQQVMQAQPGPATNSNNVGSDLDDRLEQMTSQLSRFDSSGRPSSYQPVGITAAGRGISGKVRPVIGIGAVTAPATTTSIGGSASKPSFFRDPVPAAPAAGGGPSLQSESFDRSESGGSNSATAPINAAAFLAKLKETQDQQQSNNAIQHFSKHPHVINNAVLQGKFSSPQVYSSSVSNAGGGSNK